MSARGLEPAILIHRGHSYHVDKTIPYIRSSTKLVFLGSCRGLGKLDAVVENAPDAAVIATKAVGSHRINDPLLKTLNDELLRGSPSLDWPAFWAAQQARLGSTGLFADYIPPYRNRALAFLRGYFAHLNAR